MSRTNKPKFKLDLAALLAFFDAEEANDALRQRAERAERELGMSRKSAQQEQPAPGVFEVQRIYEMAQHPALASEIAALRRRAERAERERDEARITKQKVDEHVNVAAEVVRLRVRIAELEDEARAVALTHHDGMVKDGNRIRELETRVAELESRPRLGADVVERLRIVFNEACEDAHERGESGRLKQTAGIRAVLSTLAAMGWEAIPSHDATNETAAAQFQDATSRCGFYAGACWYGARLAPVFGAQKATIAEQAQRIAELEAALAATETEPFPERLADTK